MVPSDESGATGGGSTERIRTMRDRYLSSPLAVDIEYIKYYTEAHEKTSGWHAIERRAECHAYALEHLTPMIRDAEPFVGSKTQYVRGAIPYCNYASDYMLRELQHIEQDAQQALTEVGTGGGIARGRDLVQSGEFLPFGKKFLLAKADVPILEECARYWTTRCMQGVGDRLWKDTYKDADQIEKGWDAILYTAPHDPAPEGRLILDYDAVLQVGFRGLIDRMREKIAETRISDWQSAEKVYFWRAGIRTLEGTIRWANNHADAADAKAQEIAQSDPGRAEELRAIATRCRRVPEHPAGDFREAMQSYWFAYLAGHIEGAHLGFSPGRFDRYMYPFFKRSFDSGAISEAEALEWLEALRVKMTEIEYVASFSWEGLGSGNLFQNMILGGVDEHGHGGDNELSSLCVQAAINCSTTQPTLSVWYDPALSEPFLLKAVDCVRTGCGFPAFFNLKVFVQHELQFGKSKLAEIRKYAAMGGCTEPVLEGQSYGVVQPGFINHGKLLELALFGGKDPRTGIQFDETPLPQSYEDLLETYETHMRKAIRCWQEYWNIVMAAHRQTTNLIYASVLTRDCIERGMSMDDGGAVCNHTPTTLSSGLVNVVNSFAAVKKIVEEDRLCTMDELRTALANDWKDSEELHRQSLAAPKWGNNDPKADSIYVEIFDRYCRAVREGINYLGEPYDPSMLAISTHAPFGRSCGATPDGRVAGQTLADGVTSPFPGTDKNGPFSVMLSASRIDHTQIRGGLHNMKFHPMSIRGVRGAKNLLALIRAYFQSNGFQIQFNVVDSNTLRDAQAHPEKYRDLIVRVAGFSAFFVELGKSIQEEVIERTEHELGA